MAKNKPNPLLAKYEAIYRAQYLRQLQIANQMGLDAAIIAANEVLGLGAGRAEQFAQKYIETMNKMAEMMASDGADDPELAWRKSTIDKRLLQIVGKDNFQPWDKRYKEG